MPREYDRVTIGGKQTDYRTAVMLRRVQKALGGTFYVYQGSYSDGSLSAGTHSGGGALDVNVPAGKDANAVTRQLRNAGFAAWYRTTAQGFDPHIHAIDIGNKRLSPEARSQVTKYHNGYDGLAGYNADPQPYRPGPLNYYRFVSDAGFDFQAWKEAQRLRDKLADLGSRIKELTRLRRRTKKQLERLS